MGRLVVEEFAVPYLLLGLPVNDEALFDGSAKGDLAEVLALVELGANKDLFVAVAGDAIGDDAGPVGFLVGHEACLDGIGAVVEYQRPCGGRWTRGS